MPTYLYPTSNDDLVHPVKTSLSGQNPDFSHNQSGSDLSFLAGHTENADDVPELQQQKGQDLYGDLLIRDNWAPRATFRITPSKGCETSSEGMA